MVNTWTVHFILYDRILILKIIYKIDLEYRNIDNYLRIRVSTPVLTLLIVNYFTLKVYVRLNFEEIYNILLTFQNNKCIREFSNNNKNLVVNNNQTIK